MTHDEFMVIAYNVAYRIYSIYMIYCDILNFPKAAWLLFIKKQKTYRMPPQYSDAILRFLPSRLSRPVTGTPEWTEAMEFVFFQAPRAPGDTPTLH